METSPPGRPARLSSGGAAAPRRREPDAPSGTGCGKKPPMPRTRNATQSLQGGTKENRKTAPRAPKNQGWRTTDDEEIERRRQRAATEPLAIEELERGYPVFG